MPVVGASETLSLGPGTLYHAPLGTAEPVDLVTALAAGWTQIGFTEDGSEFSYEVTADPVEVAEAYDPLFHKTSSRNGTVSFSMAENTVRNLTRAFNGGKVTKSGTGAAAILTYEPPEPGEEIGAMMLFESEDRQERWVWRQVYQSGAVALSRKKGADKTLIPVEFMIQKPATKKRPWVAIYADARSGGLVVV